MCKRPFQKFTAPPQQILAPLAFHSPFVGVNSGLLIRLVFPLAPLLFGSRDVSPHVPLAHLRHHGTTVITLVCDDFTHPVGMNSVFAWRGWRADLFRHRNPGLR